MSFDSVRVMFRKIFFNYIAEEYLFSMFLSILTNDFDLILGSFLTFLGPNGLSLGLG